MYEIIKLCQEMDSDHDDVPPRGNYSNCSDDKSSHTQRPIDELCQKGDTDDYYFLQGAILVKKRGECDTYLTHVCRQPQSVEKSQ